MVTLSLGKGSLYVTSRCFGYISSGAENGIVTFRRHWWHVEDWSQIGRTASSMYTLEVFEILPPQP